MTGVSDHTRLGDVCELIKGKKPKRVFETKENGAIPYILIQSFTNSATKFTNDLDLPQCTRNDVLMVMDGASSGLVAIGVEGAIGSTLAAIRPRTDMVYPKYLYHWLKTKYNLLNRRTRGSAIPHTDRKLLQDLLVPTPPLETQKRITAVLDKADLLRLKREQANQLTNKIIRSVFLKMFGNPYTNPKEWRMTRIGDLTEVWSGGTPSRRVKEYFGGGIPWVTTTQVNDYIVDSTHETISKLGLENSNAKLCPRHTVLLAMIGAGKTRGMATILNIEAATNQNFAAILPSSKFHAFYLWQLLRLSYDRLRSLGRGVNQPALNLEIVKSIEIPIPPLDLQNKFALIVEGSQRLRPAQEQSTAEINELFHSLMQRAFRGKLVS